MPGLLPLRGPGDVSLSRGLNMTKFAFPTHPLLLGFEPLERLVQRTARAGAEGYPPFNIEVTENGVYTITLAVAGFREEEIAITLEDRQLVVRGQQADPEDERVFLHRGIATRQFRRVFALAEGVEVMGAGLENGLLTVTLQRREPEPVVRSIPINRG